MKREIKGVSWEAIINGHLCRLKEDENGQLEAVVHDGNARQINRIKLSANISVSDAKSMIVSAATQFKQVKIATTARMTAEVKWFNDGVGYGFATMEDGNDIFIHYSSIIMDGFKSLEEGQKVEFGIVEDLNNRRAHNVIKTDDLDYLNFNELLSNTRDVVALTIDNSNFRVVNIAPDGKWRFVDQLNRSHRLLYLPSIDSDNFNEAIKQGYLMK